MCKYIKMLRFLEFQGRGDTPSLWERNRRRGFTFLELLVVTFLMALAAAIIVPRVVSLVERRETFEDQLRRFLLSAKVRSVARHENLLLVVDPAERALLLFRAGDFPESEPLSKLSVPEEVEVKEEGVLDLGEGRVGVVFFAEGYSSGGELEFVNRETGKSLVFFFPRAQMLPLLVGRNY